MSRYYNGCCRVVGVFLCLLLGACLATGVLPAVAQRSQSASNIPPPPQWPMEFMKDGTRLLIYQPQLENWQKFRVLTADTAISLTPNGGKPVLGVVSWRSDTLADLETRMVVIKDTVLTSARFPSLDPVSSAAMERLVRETFPATGMTISLDRILAGFRAVQATSPPAEISTQPPPIFVSTAPAIVLFVDGQPVRAPIQGTKLEFVVNTNWDLFFDKSDYYLLDQKTWLKAKELSGPWAVTDKLPPDMAKLPANQNWDEVKRAVPPAAASKQAPRVFFTNKPAELLLFRGEPTYASIQGTHLAYATNTKNDVFLHSPDRQVYVLLSGRWFGAPKLEGPWNYAGNNLPEDFARIPPTHPRSHVLVSVPGTQAAHDAVLLAQIPTTAIVNRVQAEAQVKVAFAGEPQFKPIENTSLSYAANTQEKVIKVGDLYYLCFQGVWFMSTNPNGPWNTADSVPKAIYEIPPSSPVYNVTYVTVTNPTPTTVESSYTSGYVGMFVLGAAVGACIAYGTGYYYPPYYYWGPHPYPIFYPYPYSYGFRAVYNPSTGFYGVGGVVYGPYGSAGRAAWYNPSTGFYGRAATVQTAYGGRTVAQAYNPWTGTYGATAQGHNAYAQWGSSVAQRGDDWVRSGHITTDQGTVARYRTSDGGHGTIVNGPSGPAGIVKTADNDVYAGKDGNLYKRDPNGNWSKYDDGNWTPVDKSAQRQEAQQRAQAAGVSRESLQQQAQSAGITRDSVTQAREDRPAGAQTMGREFNQTGQSSMGQARSVSPDTVRQLNSDAFSRQQGAFREQMRSRGAASGGFRRR